MPKGKTDKRPAKDCKHFWYLVGGKPKWFNGHALAKCKYCTSWTVIEYGADGVGPCHHIVLKEQLTELSLGQILELYESKLEVGIPASKRWKDLPR